MKFDVENFLSDIIVNGTGVSEFEKAKLERAGFGTQELFEIFYQRVYELKGNKYDIPTVSIKQVEDGVDHIPILDLSLNDAIKIVGRKNFEITNPYGFMVIEGNLLLIRINIHYENTYKPELYISTNILESLTSVRVNRTLDKITKIEIEDIIIVNQ